MEDFFLHGNETTCHSDWYQNAIVNDSYHHAVFEKFDYLKIISSLTFDTLPTLQFVGVINKAALISFA